MLFPLNSIFSRGNSSWIFSRAAAFSPVSAYDRRISRANETAPRENSSDKLAGTGRVSVPASPRVMTPLFHVYSIAVLKLRPGRRKVGAITRRGAERFLGEGVSGGRSPGNNNIKRK